MNFVSGLLTYMSIWWIVIFLILPLGVRKDESPQAGLAAGAPKKAHIKKKLLWTTIATTVLWGFLYAAIQLTGVNLRTLIRGADLPPWAQVKEGSRTPQQLAEALS